MAEKLVAGGADATRKDGRLRRSLLHLAAIEGHDDLAALLLGAGLPVNEEDGQGCTPADYADRYGHRSTAALLAAAGGGIRKGKAAVGASEGLPSIMPGQAEVVKLTVPKRLRVFFKYKRRLLGGALPGGAQGSDPVF